MQPFTSTIPIGDELIEDEENIATSSAEEDSDLPNDGLLEEEPPVPEPETPAPPPMTAMNRAAGQFDNDDLEDARRDRIPALAAPNVSGIGSTVPL